MQNQLENLARLLRYYSLVSTTAAGSGHPSSCLSAADLMAVLCFGGFYRYDLDNPEYLNNDRLIFSKGHAAPLFYSIYAAAGKVAESELLSLRKFGSPLEGHPTSAFPYTEVPTGSLGQGLSVGVGMALNAKLDKLSYRTFVLLGDSEMAEGSVWEAMALAAYYKLDNLVGILDLNRLGQRGETMYGHDVLSYQKKVESFGWEAVVIDGHDLAEIQDAFRVITQGNFKSQESRTKGIPNSQFPISNEKPVIIIAKTLKGKGVSVMENQDGWHGKPLSREELEQALSELGGADTRTVGEMAKPEPVASGKSQAASSDMKFTDYLDGKPVATRKAYGNALAHLADANPDVVVLDAETSNSTYADAVKKKHPERFFEMFIAEQNMVGAALGFARRGKVPFVSTFAAFLTRAYDQIRMSALAQSNIKFVGSHAGVSIGEDGSSQMGLEEIAMFRALPETVVLYPSDAVSTEKLVYEAAKHRGNVYLQTARKETAILYSGKRQETRDKLTRHEFKIGGSCTLKSSDFDAATVISAGVTLHEALAAHEELQKENISIRVIDLYSIKPLDLKALQRAAAETKAIITVEDNHREGGLAEAVLYGISESGLSVKFKALSVDKIPHSGKPGELLAFMEIDKDAIIKAVKSII